MLLLLLLLLVEEGRKHTFKGRPDHEPSSNNQRARGAEECIQVNWISFNDNSNGTAFYSCLPTLSSFSSLFLHSSSCLLAVSLNGIVHMCRIQRVFAEADFMISPATRESYDPANSYFYYHIFLQVGDLIQFITTHFRTPVSTSTSTPHTFIGTCMQKCICRWKEACGRIAVAFRPRWGLIIWLAGCWLADWEGNRIEVRRGEKRR